MKLSHDLRHQKFWKNSNIIDILVEYDHSILALDNRLNLGCMYMGILDSQLMNLM